MAVMAEMQNTGDPGVRAESWLGCFRTLERNNTGHGWHVLRTGEDNPDWEKLGGDHYIADWERRFWKLSRN
jgi:hypothetical protein